MMNGIWQRLQSLFKPKAVAENLKEQPAEPTPPELNRLSQMQARSTLQGMQSLQAKAVNQVKPTSTGSFKRWADQPDRLSCGNEGAIAKPVKADVLPGTSLSNVPGISKRQSMQELLDIGSDHFSAE